MMGETIKRLFRIRSGTILSTVRSKYAAGSTRGVCAWVLRTAKFLDKNIYICYDLHPDYPAQAGAASR